MRREKKNKKNSVAHIRHRCCLCHHSFSSFACSRHNRSKINKCYCAAGASWRSRRERSESNRKMKFIVSRWSQSTVAHTQRARACMQATTGMRCFGIFRIRNTLFHSMWYKNKLSLSLSLSRSLSLISIVLAFVASMRMCASLISSTSFLFRSLSSRQTGV